MSLVLNIFTSQDIIEKYLFPILVGISTYLIFRKFDDWEKRKNQSKLGVAIIDALIEEIKTGIGIMSEFQKSYPNPVNLGLLPNKSWDGMLTISDDVLLRIIKVSQNIKSKSFPLNDIRIHCKNYFGHMCLSWELAINDRERRNERLIGLINDGKYIEAANAVLPMLEQARNLLVENSNRYFPK